MSQRLAIVPQCVGASHTEGVDNICIVSEREDSGIRKIARQKRLRPENLGFFVSPSRFAISCQAVDENNAGKFSE